ncbi:MAG: DMT family transporter [Clostridia bacterium]|nr:DMT family transporter [Clostridia bacterium]
MLAGIIAGVTWALETIVLGYALGMAPFCSTSEAIFLAPFVSTFLHDGFSAIWSAIYNGARGNSKNVLKAFKTKSGKFVVIAAIIGGPVGMTGYVMSVNYMGASIGAVTSAIFPAIGAVLAFFFLKEKMKWYQWLFLIATLLGVYGLYYSPEMHATNYALGILGAILCSFGWGIEAVILAKSLTDPEVTDEYALQIRQTTSAITYGVILLPVISLIKGWGIAESWKFAGSLFASEATWLIPTIALAGLCATVSYLFYYKSISQIGASKAMGLNVTYGAWALVFTAIIMRTMPSMISIVCATVVLICSVFAAADFKEIFKNESK